MNKDLWKLQIAFAAYQVFFRSIIDLCVCNNKQPCAKSYRSENIDVRDVALKGLIGELRIGQVWRYGIQGDNCSDRYQHMVHLELWRWRVFLTVGGWSQARGENAVLLFERQVCFPMQVGGMAQRTF